jgi:nicotinate-nucleotide--dimethylbenzimidazole phosphoribosyltransferase
MDKKVRKSSRNILEEPAMTSEEYQQGFTKWKLGGGRDC